jgi:hypothetical protein
MDRLDGIDAKLNRAEQQIGALKRFPETWTTREQPYAFQPDIDEGKRRYIWVLDVRKPIPPLPAVISDEIIHHLRSVLDHLASHLVERFGGDPGHGAWPIEGSRWGWERNVERRQHWWQVWRQKRGGPLGPIPRGSAIWTFIESTQPYKSGGKARDDVLFGLNENWNHNKHRILNPLTVEAAPEGDPINMFHVRPAIEPIESRWIMRRGDKLDHGAKIAIFRFPDDVPLPTMEVKMNLQFPVQVAMGDEKGPTHDLEETLERVRSIVARAKALP